MSNSASSFEQVYRDLLRKIRDEGKELVSAEMKSDGKTPKWITRELIAQTFKLDNPRDRLIINPFKSINIYQAIGQFLWILSGSYHLSPILYYQDKAATFSTDKKIMIGAYGFRLYGPAYLNQMDTILKNLTRNHTSRRAVASVYMPEFDRQYDAAGGKLDDEIPCALNFQFLIRNDKLDMIVYMRSQNVHNLLPYDVFIFTMLQEYQASLLQKDVGTYHHFAGSFHFYTDERLNEVNSIINDTTSACQPMQKMPFDDASIYARRLIEFENELRTEVTKVQEGYANKVLRAEHYFLGKADKMPEYWKQLALILMVYSCSKLKDKDNFRKISKRITPPFKIYTDRHMKEMNIT